MYEQMKAMTAQQEWRGTGVVQTGAESKVEPKHPPVYERLEAIERVSAELDEVVTILERKLEPLCRPNAPTPTDAKAQEIERATSSLAAAIRQTEHRLLGLGWRLRTLVDTLEV